MLILVFDEIVSALKIFPVAVFTSCNHQLTFDEIVLLVNVLLFAPSIYTPMKLAVIVFDEIVLRLTLFEENDNQIPSA
jgi:hypothetical protein